MLALDLGVVNRKAHVITWREAGIWSAIWIGLALAFNAAVYVWQGPEVGLQFLTGYLIEKSLSVDNIFVFVLLFAAFGVPAAYQHRVLFWGVLGALVMRGALIGLGTALIASFSWVLYLFGAFLVITGIRMAHPAVHEMHPERNPVVRIARRLFPVTETFEGARFSCSATAAGTPRRCSSRSCWSRRPTSCSPSTPSRRSSPLRLTLS